MLRLDDIGAVGGIVGTAVAVGSTATSCHHPLSISEVEALETGCVKLHKVPLTLTKPLYASPENR